MPDLKQPPSLKGAAPKTKKTAARLLDEEEVEHLEAMAAEPTTRPAKKRKKPPYRKVGK